MNDNFYKSIIQNYPIGYAHHKILYDKFHKIKDYEFIEINKVFEKIIGFKNENLIGKKASNILIGRFTWIDFYNKIKKNSEGEEFEYYFEILDKYYKINIYYPDENNMIIFFRDTTKEIKQKENYDLFTDNTNTQIWYLQDPVTYGSVNKAHADFLGFEKENLQFKKIYDLYSPEEASQCININKRVFKEKKQVETKEWIVNSKGRRRLLKVLKNPKFNAKGEVDFILCSAKDITEEYELEEEKNIKEKILYSMIDFTKELLTNDDHYKALSNGIEMIGNATKVDRVYYWENHYDERSEKWLTSHRFEWCLGGVEQQINNPELQNVPFEEAGDFIGGLSQNKPFITHIKNMGNTATKKVLESQGILSILVLPVFTNGHFQGFIGFDSCRFERKWSNVEISLLNSFVLLYEKSVEKSLMKQHMNQVKENFDNFFNMVNDFLFVINKDGIIINANDTALKKLNYSKSEIIGQSVLKLHPEDKIEKSQNILRNILDGKVNNFNTMAVTKNGSTIPIETHISKGIWDGEDVFFAVSKDTTELTMSEEKFSKAFNLSGIGMVISTFEEGKFFEVNDTFLNMIRCKREDVIGKRLVDLSIFGNVLEGENLRKRIRRDRALYNYEIQMLYKENTIKTGPCNIVPVNINNEPYLLTSIIDITESKLMTKELAKAKKASDIANKAKSEFLSHMSHEIRTPMNAVIGYSNLLSSTILTQKQEKYIDGVKASCGMLMSIINDILDWSKIDSNKLDLENKAFNIDQVINNVVDQQMFKNLNAEVEILVEKGEEVPEILYGDFLRLQQILLNLLSNAVKFTKVGEIKIKVNRVESQRDRVTLEFKVIDTGIGIPEEAIGDIFQPFKQANNRILSQCEGTGLGLSICEKIVKLMNGSIGVESKVNEGSTFFFTVDFAIKALEKPVYIEKNKRNCEKNICIGQNQEVCKKDNICLVHKLQGLKLLVVDDNRINQDVLKEILKDVGIVVTLASSGMEAIGRVEKEEFHIILMDLRMPLMDGYEATKEIRKIKSPEELPIIAVTASVSPDEVKKCMESGINDFISKPIEREKLFIAIWNLTNKSLNLEGQINFLGKDQKEKSSLVEDRDIYKIELHIDGIDTEKTLERLNNNQELFIKILKKFKNNHANVVDEIKEALCQEDRELAIRLAHTIKGVSGEIAAEKVYSISKKLENEMTNGNFNISDLLKGLEKQLDKIFRSKLFLEEEKKEEKSINSKDLDIRIIKPVLKNLEILLLERDLDAIEYIEKLEKITKHTFINDKVIQIKEYGEQYDFEEALNIFNDINIIINKRPAN